MPSDFNRPQLTARHISLVDTGEGKYSLLGRVHILNLQRSRVVGRIAEIRIHEENRAA